MQGLYGVIFCVDSDSVSVHSVYYGKTAAGLVKNRNAALDWYARAASLLHKPPITLGSEITTGSGYIDYPFLPILTSNVPRLLSDICLASPQTNFQCLQVSQLDCKFTSRTEILGTMFHMPIGGFVYVCLFILYECSDTERTLL